MIIVFVTYLVIVIALAIYFARKSKTQDDFVMGGRKIPGFALALSERAAGESSWLLLGLTGHAFIEGLGSVWVALGCVIGILFIWWVMADRLRTLSVTTGANTIPSLFAKRFPGSAFSIQMLSSAIIIFFFLFYIAAQFSGAGKVLFMAFGVDEFWGSVLSALLIVVYTMLGGFISVVAIDVFQALLMFISIVVIPIVAMFFLASHDLVIANALAEAGPQMSTFTMGKSGTAAWLFVLSGLSWALGYTGQPHLLARMMAISNRKQVKIARGVASSWTIVAYIGAILMGLTGFVLMQNGFFDANTQALMDDHEKLLPTMLAFLVTPVIAGILLSGAVSAMMSTAASQLMVCTFSITEDIVPNTKYKGRVKRKIWLSRGIIIVVGIIAFITGITMSDTVYGLVSYAWAGIGSSFGPALLLLLFWKRFSAAGVIASLIGGTGGAIIWKLLYTESTGISERLTSFVFALVMAILFSLLIPTNKNKKLKPENQ
ncbi:MAG: sodium:proline symporter [Marinilabiliales bacterium]|nr:MAG: sodium:proline symporter [Marinilabiliales bacterium]